MDKIIIEEKYILEYIKDMLNDCQSGKQKIKDAKYHHNCEYKDASSICKNGILSVKQLRDRNIKTFSDEQILRMSNYDSHVNGENGVSLAVMGLTDLYPDEDEYNAFLPLYVDFLVSSNVYAYRSNFRYGNEFIAPGGVVNTKLQSVDIRLHNLMAQLYVQKNFKGYDIHDVVCAFNELKNISQILEEEKLDIPIREMSSNEDIVLDKQKLIKTKELILKK